MVINVYGDQMKEQDRLSNFNGLNIVDSMSSSGLRTIRYLKEITPFSLINKIYVNDLSSNS